MQNIYFILLFCCVCCFAANISSHDSKPNRSKRFIIFDGMGVVKLVVGLSSNIIVNERLQKRGLYSLSYFYNFQAQYVPPPRPIYWWSFFNSSTFAARHHNDERTASRNDISRNLLYSAIEVALERAGYQDSACLERAICEVAQLPFATGSLYNELLNVALVPGDAKVNKNYMNAKNAGLKNANCTAIYSKCQNKAWRWFERITQIIPE